MNTAATSPPRTQVTVNAEQETL